VGRFVTGLGIGASAIVVPAYLAEIAPAARRGAVVQMYEVMLCMGMLAAVLADFLLQVGGLGAGVAGRGGVSEAG
jgi:MFS family permease